MKLPRIDLSRLRALAASRGLSLHLSGRQRKIARWAGMVLLAIASFLITLKFTFPYERLKGKLVDALSEKYDVTVGDVGGGFLPGTVVFEDLVLRSRPATPEEKASEISIDELTIDLGLDFGLLGALRQKAVFAVEADLGAGEVEGEVEVSSSMMEAHVETQGLALANLPGVTAAVGLPMTGSLDAQIDLRLPGGKWKNAEGRIHIDCEECTVGDGVTKMTMTPNTSTASGRRRRATAAAAAWGAQGVTVPRLSLGEAAVLVEIDKGVGEIKTFAAESKDGWLKIEGKIEFRDPFINSAFPGCMRFKLSDDLKKRAPDFGNIEYTLSEKVRQADGSYAIPTKGKLTELRWDVRRKCGGGSIDDDADGRPGDRPGLVGGRPSLEVEVPPQGGLPVDPSQLPGVAGQGEVGANGEAQVPGASAPPMGAGAPPVPGMDDGGTGAAAVQPSIPPPPPESEVQGGGRELRRYVPEEQPVEGGNEPAPPMPPPPNFEDGGEMRPIDPSQPAPEAAPNMPVERYVQPNDPNVNVD